MHFSIDMIVLGVLMPMPLRLSTTDSCLQHRNEAVLRTLCGDALRQYHVYPLWDRGELGHPAGDHLSHLYATGRHAVLRGGAMLLHVIVFGWTEGGGWAAAAAVALNFSACQLMPLGVAGSGVSAGCLLCLRMLF